MTLFMGRVHLSGDCRATSRQITFNHQFLSGSRPSFEQNDVNKRTTVNDSKEQTGVSTIESSNDIEPGNLELVIQQAFINYNFLYTRFCACKTVWGARPCSREIEHVNSWHARY